MPFIVLAPHAVSATRDCPADAVIATTSPTPHPDVQVDLQRYLAEQLTKTDYKVIALGDSILQGWPRGQIGADFGTEVLNAGVGQDGTEQVLWRLKNLDWSRQEPDYVLLLVGTNDLRYPACAVARGILAVVREAHGAFPRARLVVTSILPRGDELRQADTEIDEVNELLRGAVRQCDFLFLDAHDAFLAYRDKPGAVYLAGNLHLSAAGYSILDAALRALFGR
jgi:lysophospholipase L1-like esterase